MESGGALRREEVGELGRVGAEGQAGQAQADMAQLCRHHPRLDRIGQSEARPGRADAPPHHSDVLLHPTGKTYRDAERYQEPLHQVAVRVHPQRVPARHR